jgi:polyisoprenoid-binding protein YceI
MRKTIRSLVLVSATTLSFLLADKAFASDYGLKPERKVDSVHFRSNAKMEFIEGITTNIVGTFSVDPDNVDTVSGIVRCDLRTLETGIETRDGHMRDRHLHTDKFPFAYFQLTSQEGLPKTLVEGEPHKATGIGKFFIHGVSREIRPQLEVRRVNNWEGETIFVRATFQIRLDDYEIPRPKALLFKLAEVISVDVQFSAYRNVKSDNIILPQWKLLK